MLNLDEKHFMPHCHHDEPGVFPSAKPRYTMTEEVEHTAREMRNTIDRILRFEKHLEAKVEDLLKHITADNVTFKNTFSEGYNTFIMEVKNEVNAFESNVNATIALFQSTLESDYANLSEDVRAQIQTINDNFTAALNNYVQEYTTAFTAFCESIGSTIESNNSNFETILHDFQVNVDNRQSTFETEIRTAITTFNSAVNSAIATLQTELNTRLLAQDTKITDIQTYLTTNLATAVANKVEEMAANGTFSDIIAEELLPDVMAGVNKIKEGYEYIDTTVATEGSDISDKVKSALASTGKVKIIGNFTIQEIEIASGKVIYLDGALNVTGKYGFWFNGTNSKLHGVGEKACITGDNNNVPIVIGSDVDNVAHTITAFCDVSNITVTNGKVGVLINNNESNQKFTYFNKVHNINVKMCDRGIELRGYADANFIDSVVFYEVGDASNGAIHFDGIYERNTSKVPLENVISNVFHTNSENAVTIFFNCSAFYNTMVNIASEPGGAGSMFCKSTGFEPYKNVLMGVANNQGGDFNGNFTDKNTVIIQTKSFYPEVTTTKLTTEEQKGRYYKEFTYYKEQIGENSEHPLFTVNSVYQHRSVFVKVEYITENSLAAAPLMTGGVETAVLYNIGGGPVIGFNKNLGLVNGKLCLKMPTNGGSSAIIRLVAKITLIYATESALDFTVEQ